MSLLEGDFNVPGYLEQLDTLETQCSELNWNNYLSYWPLLARIKHAAFSEEDSNVP